MMPERFIGTVLKTVGSTESRVVSSNLTHPVYGVSN